MMMKNVSSVKKSSSKSVIEMRNLETNQEYKYLEDMIENINTKLIDLVSLDNGMMSGVGNCMITHDAVSLTLFL